MTAWYIVLEAVVHFRHRFFIWMQQYTSDNSSSVELAWTHGEISVIMSAITCVTHLGAIACITLHKQLMGDRDFAMEVLPAKKNVTGNVARRQCHVSDMMFQTVSDDMIQPSCSCSPVEICRCESKVFSLDKKTKSGIMNKM